MFRHGISRLGIALTAATLWTGCAVDAGDAPPPTSDEAIVEMGNGVAMHGGVRYLRTPGGYTAEACVHLVPDNARIEADNSVTNPDGTRTTYADCPYPRLDGHGVAITADHPVASPRSGSETAPEASSTAAPEAAPGATINGWVEAAQWTSLLSVGRLSVQWTVPPVPQRWDGQTIFLFPGMEPGSYSEIIQPVLQ